MQLRLVYACQDIIGRKFAKECKKKLMKVLFSEAVIG